MRARLLLLMATMPWFLSNNVFAGEHGETDNRVPLYNAHKGITFVQDKKIRLDSCFIQSKIYNDSTRMDVVYYVTGVSSLNPVRLQLPVYFNNFKERLIHFYGTVVRTFTSCQTKWAQNCIMA